MYFLYINIYIILSTPRVVTVVYVVVKNRQLRGVFKDNRDNKITVVTRQRLLVFGRQLRQQKQQKQQKERTQLRDVTR